MVQEDIRLLLTNAQRFRRKLTDDPSCKFCPAISESMVHLLRDCPHAKLIWNIANVPRSMQRTSKLDWSEWLDLCQYSPSWL